MGPSVAVILNNREHYLRFGLRNSRLAVSALQNAMPQRADKLSIGDAAVLVLRQDQDAILVFTHRGINHEERETVKFDQIERWMERDLDAGRDMSEFSLPILEALKQAHLITLNYAATVQDHDDNSGKVAVGAFVEADPLLPRGSSAPLARTGEGSQE